MSNQNDDKQLNLQTLKRIVNAIQKRNRLAISFLVVAIAIPLGYQNCGPGFGVLEPSLNSLGADLDFIPSVTKYEDGNFVVLGDMILPEKVYEDLNAKKDKVSITGNLPSTLQAWPGGVIPVSIPKYVFFGEPQGGSRLLKIQRDATDAEYAAMRTAVQRACDTISAVANVRCLISGVPSQTLLDNTLNALILSDTDTIWCSTDPKVSCARVGGPGTTDTTGTALIRPWMAIRAASINSPGLVLHEFGHVLGLLHEHQRSDAGEYLVVSPAIPESEKSSVFRLTSYTGIIQGSAFDFGSMMMYGSAGELNADFLRGVYPFAIKKEYFGSGGNRENRLRGMDNTIARPSVQDVFVLQSIYGAPAMTRQSCLLGSRTIPHGSYISVFNPETVTAAGYSSCTSSARFCDNGVLSGTGDKLTCDISCKDGALSVPYAVSQTFFERESVSAGQTCRSQVRQCSSAGLSVPAGQSAFRAISCAQAATPTPTPAPKNCVAGSITFQSATANSAGMKNSCTATWTEARPSATVRVVAMVTGGGSASALCGNDGNFYNEMVVCPPLADPPAGTVTCASKTETIMSAPNNRGDRTSCVATLPTSPSGPNRVAATVTGGGTYSAICSNVGLWASPTTSCPAPADVAATPTPTPTPVPGGGTASCVGSSQMWTVGGLNCTAVAPMLTHNTPVELTNTVNAIAGKATFRCVDGQRVLQASPAPTCRFVSDITPVIDTNLQAPTKPILSADVRQAFTISKGEPPFRIRISGNTDHVRLENGLDEMMTNSRTAVLIYRYTSSVSNALFTVQLTDAAGYSTTKQLRITASAPVATTESMGCTVISRSLAAYSMDGKIVPRSGDVGRDGRFFVAGFDPNEGAWWSFDGINWAKHDGQEANFKTIAGVTKIEAGGIAGPIFRGEDLTPFPNGQLYIGYGVGSSQTDAWNEMFNTNAKRFRLCDVLPAR